MDHLEFKAEIGAGEVPGTISGYGSIFGNEDLGGDVVIKGAFADSIASGRKVRMFWSHDMKQPIGVWDRIAEDEKGLRMSGRLALETQLGMMTVRSGETVEGAARFRDGAGRHGAPTV